MRLVGSLKEMHMSQKQGSVCNFPQKRSDGIDRGTSFCKIRLNRKPFHNCQKCLDMFKTLLI